MIARPRVVVDDLVGDVEWSVSVDARSVRAHQNMFQTWRCGTPALSWPDYLQTSIVASVE